MPGSGAGSNVLNAYLLSNVGPNSSFVSSPLTTYGNLYQGGNDSGGFAAEVRGFTKYTFQLIQVGSTALSGYQVTIYGTTDPQALQTYMYALQGRTPAGQSALPAGGSVTALAQTGFFPGIPPSSWTVLPGPSEQSGTGGIANPLTPQTPFFTASLPLVAIRAVVTASSSPAGVFSVSVIGIP